jgi:hypothetical protein
MRLQEGVLVVLALSLLAPLAGLAAAMRAPQARAGQTETLALHAKLRITGSHDSTCPAGTADTVECHAHAGSGLVPGLGTVTTSYSFRVDLGQPGCVRVLGYPATLTVAGKGSIDVVLDPVASCISPEAVFSAAQTFAVVGGSGLYSGAGGGGTLSRALSNEPAAVIGTETLTGTFDVPGLAFDTTMPSLLGARPRTLHAPRGATDVRVRYRVTAVDDRDGAVPVACRPRPGARFRVGRTTVTCSATDTSGNVATARFVVTIRRG